MFQPGFNFLSHRRKIQLFLLLCLGSASSSGAAACVAEGIVTASFIFVKGMMSSVKIGQHFFPWWVSRRNHFFFLLRFCPTWSKRYLITSQVRVKRVSRIHYRTTRNHSRMSDKLLCYSDLMVFVFFSPLRLVRSWKRLWKVLILLPRRERHTISRSGCKMTCGSTHSLPCVRLPLSSPGLLLNLPSCAKPDVQNIFLLFSLSVSVFHLFNSVAAYQCLLLRKEHFLWNWINLCTLLTKYTSRERFVCLFLPPLRLSGVTWRASAGTEPAEEPSPKSDQECHWQRRKDCCECFAVLFFLLKGGVPGCSVVCFPSLWPVSLSWSLLLSSHTCLSFIFGHCSLWRQMWLNGMVDWL